ncbi:MAG: AraC family transcriptional regulator [Clostridiales bacterium]|jgi:AraC-like DNA-binding protein|nr:AraC family transcriptional regulator [Clostridiales bacterium]
MKFSLDVLSDQSERIRYNIPDIALHISIGDLKNFHKFTTACHWHPDLEFSLPLEGDMDYFVNGITYHIPQGQGIFINSKRLHYNYSSSQSNCTYLVMTVNPFSFGNEFGTLKSYMEEKFGPPNDDVILLTPKKLRHDDLFAKMNQIYKEVTEGDNDLFYILSLAFQICAIIRAEIQPVTQKQPDKEHWMAVWQMTDFIHKNFNIKISLDDIAAAGSVCRTKCCKLFGKYLNRTPTSYLTDYRIQKSYEMLRNNSCSITEIALSCGFQNDSYYTYVFHKETGFTPREYRDKFR